VHVDALHRAAGLTGVVAGAINDILDGERQVGVLCDVGGILAAQLEADLDESLSGREVDLAPALDRSGERDMIHAWVAHQARGRLVREHQAGDESGKPGTVERAREVHAAQRRAATVLQHHRVAGEQCRNDHVHGDQQGIVPCRDVEHDPVRHVLDASHEGVLRGHQLRGERLARDRDQVLRAITARIYLAQRLGDRLAHLRGDVARDRVPVALQALDALLHHGDALVERETTPPRELVSRRSELCLERAALVVGQRDDQLPVVGIHDFEGHRSPPARCARSLRRHVGRRDASVDHELHAGHEGESSRRENSAALAISFASPKRPIGMWTRRRCRFAGVSRIFISSSVCSGPGQSAFTRMRSRGVHDGELASERDDAPLLAV
jgi:hypothetical protein